MADVAAARRPHRSGRGLRALCLAAAWLPAALALGSDFAWMRQHWQQEKLHLILHDALTSALSANAPGDGDAVLQSALGILSVEDWRQIVTDEHADPVQLAPLHFFTAKAASHHLQCAACAYLAEAAFDALALALHEFFVDARYNPLGARPDTFEQHTPAWRRHGACGHEAMTAFLTPRAVYEVQPRGLPAQTSSATGPSHFAMCTRTAPGRISAEEVLAAKVACETVVVEYMADAVGSERAARIFGAYQRGYERAWYRSNLHARTRTVLTVLPSACADQNLSCTMWAVAGECQANPNYMVGLEDTPGHCMRACGICPEFDPWATMDAAVEEELRALLAQQRVQYTEHVCAAPCDLQHQLVWGSDAACAEGPRPQAGGHDFKSALQWHVRVRPKAKAKLAEAKRKRGGADDGSQRPASLLDTVTDASDGAGDDAVSEAAQEASASASAGAEGGESAADGSGEGPKRGVATSGLAAFLRDAVEALHAEASAGDGRVDGQRGAEESEGDGSEGGGRGHDREAAGEEL